jgi:hypothetical protein
MIKRLAVTLLGALLNLAAASPDDMDLAGAQDDDQGTQVRICRIWPASSAAAACDDAWVARQAGHPVAVAAVGSSSRPHVVDVQLAVENESPDNVICAAWPVLTKALAEARNSGALKVTLDAAGIDANAVIAIASASGYRFAGARQSPEGQRLEFYVDLYWRSPSHSDA